jgi:NAD(P)-dependent dehydrogenase (short-subunit alcohol dehydrogenase family)
VAAVFAGKTAPITGAGRGIGRAIALELADAGAGWGRVVNGPGSAPTARWRTAVKVADPPTP